MEKNPYRSSRPVLNKATHEEMRSARVFRFLVVFFLFYIFTGHLAFYQKLYETNKAGEPNNLEYYFFYILLFGIIAAVGAIMILLTFFNTFQKQHFRKAAYISVLILVIAGTLVYSYYNVIESYWISIIRASFFD